MRRSRSLFLLAGSLPLGFALGCKPDAAVRKGEVLPDPAHPRAAEGSKAAVQSVDTANGGTVRGTIKFAGQAPAPVKIDMSMDPACAFGNNETEQYVVNHGALANVFVYIKSGLPATTAPGGAAVVMDQKGCQFHPHVVALQQGGSVTFTNSDATMHNVHAVLPNSGATTGGIDVSQGPMGAPQTRQMNTPVVMLPVRCNNHPWMNAYINVAPTPFFAVTGTDGTFAIQGLPPGTYTLAAVHEKLGEQDTQITLTARGTTKADFSFAGK